MIDLANITVAAGSGGRGAGSFIHVKGKRRGKADGGDGGCGGNVYLLATRDLNTLEPFRFNKDFKAENGVSGLSKLKNGAMGRDLILKVPVGTEVRIGVGGPDSESSKFKLFAKANFSSKKQSSKLESGSATPPEVIYDLVEDGQKVLAARGGEGGRGNAHLRDEYGRRPLSGEVGDEGEVVHLRLELKLIAQAGLIGLPNAGKSTLLTALTAARPQIAAYPFTTLEPNLGVMDSSQFTLPSSGQAVHSSQKEKTDNREPITVNRPAKLVLADIPGLIEGASGGKGLGHQFLRHIERTKILVHLIDASLENKWDAYQKIRGELKSHSGELNKKRELIAINKSDLVSKEHAEEIRAEFASHKKKVFFISAKEKIGISDLIKEIAKFVN